MGGCSAAAALFVIGIEPLLRALDARLDPRLHEVLRLFADDVALTSGSVERLVSLVPIFENFARCATLDLGIPKCCVIPLATG